MEKEKRWRPSLTAYRELEKKLEKQLEGTSRLVRECDIWREKFRTLLAERDKLAANVRQLEQVNTLQAAEMKVLRRKGDEFASLACERAGEIKRLRSRGLWSRIFNR